MGKLFDKDAHLWMSGSTGNAKGTFFEKSFPRPFKKLFMGKLFDKDAHLWMSGSTGNAKGTFFEKSFPRPFKKLSMGKLFDKDAHLWMSGSTGNAKGTFLKKVSSDSSKNFQRVGMGAGALKIGHTRKPSWNRCGCSVMV